MPMRLREFESFLRGEGVTIDDADGTSHHMARREGCRPYPIPAHNGRKSEIPNVYLKKCCKHFGIDPKKLPI